MVPHRNQNTSRIVRSLTAISLSILVWNHHFSETRGQSRAISAERVPWTASKFRGSPDPPLPYVLQRAWPLEFSGPISLNRIPDTNRYLVCEQDGAIYAFDGDQESPDKRLFVDFNQTPPPLSARGDNRRINLFSLTFHPQFASNHWIYVCYITTGGNQATLTHISRFQLVEANAQFELQLDSERSVLVCEGGGHNGCTLAFGNDGYLYISIGDLESPNPPDPRNTGQDISDLYSSILRIDVDRDSAECHYAIPDDNPFVDHPKARPEVYAYGLRNPFRMSFDGPTGDLWVGDVGWEAWEMVYRVRPGGNYGWAIKEGPGDVKQQPLGPTPILPADIALNHSEAASVTGGMVYRGSQHADLAGKYIFGDWITRKFWAVRFNEEQVLDTEEIAVGTVKPICFEADPSGELLILDYSEAKQAAGIFRLVSNPRRTDATSEFPIRLSASGLFTNTPLYQPAPGVYAYDINAPMWADGAQADYLLAIPGDQTAVFYDSPQTMFNWFKTHVELPKGSVLAKSYSIQSGQSRHRIETQISFKDEQGDWQYYSYRWLEGGSDAVLVGAKGESHTWDGTNASAEKPASSTGSTTVTWNFDSRSQCRICHTPWTGETVGFIEPQLRSASEPNDGASWQRLQSWGVIELRGFASQDARQPLTHGYSPADASPVTAHNALVDPADSQHPLDRRARSYLHTNCAHCHMNGGNASTAFDVSFPKSLYDTRMINQPPMRGDLGLAGAQIVSPGKPFESLLLYRIAKTGSGRMPHVGSQQTDPLGVRLIRQWIAQLPPHEEQWRSLDELCAPDFVGIPDERRSQAARMLMDSVAGAVELASALAESRVPQRLRRSIVDDAMARPAAVRDLIEPYAAADQRPQRLGPNIRPEELLSLSGNAQSGKALFAQGVGTCSSCHRVEAVGTEIGPDLTKAVTKLKTADAILASILEPSREIEEAYRAVILLTVDGQILNGRVLHRDSEELRLQNAAGKAITIPVEDIESETPSKVSLMPEQLFAPLTAQQAADILAYLASLQDSGTE